MKSAHGTADCMVVDDDEISRSIISHFVKQTDYLNLVKVCQNGVEAHNFLQQGNKPHIIYLDIEMPEMSGLELIQQLPDTNVQIILITSREKYAVEAFEHQVIDYLVKPVNYARFLKASARAMDKIEENLDSILQNSNLFVRVNHKIVKIIPKDIKYIEALSDYVLIYTSDSDQKYVVHSTMKGIEKKLAQHEHFVRVHRSFIVNIDHIEAVKDENIVIGSKGIPIGRSYKNQFMERLDIL